MTGVEGNSSPAPWEQILDTVRVELRSDTTVEQKRCFCTDFVFYSVLRGVFTFPMDDLFSVFDFSCVGVVDITFFSLVKCKRMVSDWVKSTDARLGGLHVRPLYIQEYYSVTVTMYNL